MNKLFYLVIKVLLLLVIMYSCKNLEKTVVSRIKLDSTYFPTDANWSDSLANSNQQVKDALFKLYNNNVSKFNKDFKFSLTQDEFNNLKILSFETYRIDSADFEKIDEHTSINKILKLVKTEAESYVLKDSSILLFMNQYIDKGQWRVSGTGRIFDSVGKKIESMYFNEKIKVHPLIEGDNKKYGYKKKFVVFIRNGKYMSIKYGKEVPLLQDLLEFKKNIESGLIF